MVELRGIIAHNWPNLPPYAWAPPIQSLLKNFFYKKILYLLVEYILSSASHSENFIFFLDPG